MEKLHVHEKFTIPEPRGYKGKVIAEYELDNDNVLESWVDPTVEIFWLNEFQPDGIMTTRKFDTAKTYDDAIKILIQAGEEIDAE